MVDIAHKNQQAEEAMAILVVVPEWRSRIGQRKVGHPQARSNDDLRKVAGSSWIRVPEDRVRRCALGEAYVQQRTAIG